MKKDVPIRKLSWWQQVIFLQFVSNTSIFLVHPPNPDLCQQPEAIFMSTKWHPEHSPLWIKTEAVLSLWNTPLLLHCLYYNLLWVIPLPAFFHHKVMSSKNDLVALLQCVTTDRDGPQCVCWSNMELINVGYYRKGSSTFCLCQWTKKLEGA